MIDRAWEDFFDEPPISTEADHNELIEMLRAEEQIAEYGLYVQLAAERAKQAAQQEQRNAN